MCQYTCFGCFLLVFRVYILIFRQWRRRIESTVLLVMEIWQHECSFVVNSRDHWCCDVRGPEGLYISVLFNSNVRNLKFELVGLCGAEGLWTKSVKKQPPFPNKSVNWTRALPNKEAWLRTKHEYWLTPPFSPIEYTNLSLRYLNSLLPWILANNHGYEDVILFSHVTLHNQQCTSCNYHFHLLITCAP